MSLALGGQRRSASCFELVVFLARRGANVADHEEQLRDVFGEEKTARILKDDALIGKLARLMFDKATKVEDDAGFYDAFILFDMRLYLKI